MSQKQTDISTVIIINKNQQKTKTLQIKTMHLKNIRHYGFGVVVLFFLLTGTIVYLITSNQQQEDEKNRLRSELVQLQSEAPVAPVVTVKKSNNAQAYIQGIEVKLQKINDYLQRRGVKGFSTKSVGGNGNVEAAKLSDEETYSLYDEYLNRLEHTVAFTPMGYPKMSSLTSYFGYRSDPFNSAHAEYHPGIDFKGNRGDEARCTANGKVVFAGWYGGYGNCVRIAHANSYETLYGHLSHISVRIGQEVTLGQKIGEVGSTGHSTGNHLHYEVRKNGKAVNPVNFLTLNK